MLLKASFQAGKMRVRELEAKIKDLGTCLSTKDSHMKTLNSTIQGLEKEKQQLEATAAAEKVSVPTCPLTNVDTDLTYTCQPQIQADCAAWGILKDKVQVRFIPAPHTHTVLLKVTISGWEHPGS